MIDGHDIYRCVLAASDRYAVPPALLYAIIRKEGGYLKPVNKNRNGSVDMGITQVNSEWLPKLSAYGITANSLIQNTCVNIGVGAWILKSNYEKSKDWTSAIITYNIGSTRQEGKLKVGRRYAYDVIKYWHEYHKYFS